MAIGPLLGRAGCGARIDAAPVSPACPSNVACKERRRRLGLPRGALLSCVAATLCAATPALAADPTPEPLAVVAKPPVATTPPAVASPPDPPKSPPVSGPRAFVDPAARRDPAFYRGRTNFTTAAEGASWVPRVLFYPVHGVLEFGLRRPIYAGAELVDRKHIVPLIEHWLNPTPDISWSPTLSFDLSGVTLEPAELKSPSSANGGNGVQLVTYLGLQGKWRNLGVPGHDLRAQTEVGIATGAFRVAGRDQWQLGRGLFAGARGEYSTRPDRPYYGLGPCSADHPSRFEQTRSEGFVFTGFEPGPHLRLELTEGFRAEHTGPGTYPSIDDVFDTALIPGFGDLRLAMAMLDVTADSRDGPAENDGLRVTGNVTYARDVDAGDRTFVTGEIDAEGALEIANPDRVLAARVYAMDTQPLGKQEVPFTHLATLGWDRHHGFVGGRFRGESALFGQLQYRYPIAYYVDAQWTASVGNVFSRHLGDFRPSALTASFGFGLRTRRTGMTPLQITFAMGTTRFDEPFGLGNVRFFIGNTDGL